ncbi:uncharacterized protein LOC132314855 [Cornus florida]|uniref:uncharacterized protein LOC132314855 n=1 Tax=Cornus florida TaxID=4283 RepID=UPI0028A20DE4|nr:uncharacterized protein LOC132314855 [Cornus florida]
MVECDAGVRSLVLLSVARISLAICLVGCFPTVVEAGFGGYALLQVPVGSLFTTSEWVPALPVVLWVFMLIFSVLGSIWPAVGFHSVFLVGVAMWLVGDKYLESFVVGPAGSVPCGIPFTAPQSIIRYYNTGFESFGPYNKVQIQR